MTVAIAVVEDLVWLQAPELKLKKPVLRNNYWSQSSLTPRQDTDFQQYFQMFYNRKNSGRRQQVSLRQRLYTPNR